MSAFHREKTFSLWPIVSSQSSARMRNAWRKRSASPSLLDIGLPHIIFLCGYLCCFLHIQVPTQWFFHYMLSQNIEDLLVHLSKWVFRLCKIDLPLSLCVSLFGVVHARGLKSCWKTEMSKLENNISSETRQTGRHLAVISKRRWGCEGDHRPVGAEDQL